MVFGKEVAKSYLKYCHSWFGDEDMAKMKRKSLNEYVWFYRKYDGSSLQIKYDMMEDKVVVDEHIITESDSYPLGNDPDWISYKKRGKNNKYVFSMSDNDTEKILKVNHHSDEFLEEYDSYGGENPNNGLSAVVEKEYQYLVPDDFEILNGLEGIELKKLEESAKGAKR